jgi:tripartite-type tricarboxylate transporter receptor subunit TctC
MHRRTLLACLGAMAAPLPSWAADPWPAKPVTLVVPSSAGGGTDAFARTLAQSLSESLKQTVIVDNRPGASGNLGAEFVARTLPDGHTFLLAASAAVAINQALFQKMPFDPERDLLPVARGVSSPYMLLAAPWLKVTSLADFITRARREPGKLAFGSAGVGSVPYLGVRMLEEASGTRFLHIPYKGLAPAFQDLIGGQLAFMLSDLASAAAHLGRVTPLAASARLPTQPRLPTFAEAGYPTVRPDTHFSLLAPAATPAAIVNRMSAEVNAAMRKPAVAARLDHLGLLPVFDTPEGFAKALREDRAAWAAFIRRNGIKQGD